MSHYAQDAAITRALASSVGTRLTLRPVSRDALPAPARGAEDGKRPVAARSARATRQR
jgi:hypothetical protein